MLKTLIAITAILLIVAITIWIVRRACHRCDGAQFPTSYTLLKSSPQIDRRETMAVRVILGLMVAFVLLLLTSLF
jgi:hypothetical protein